MVNLLLPIGRRREGERNFLYPSFRGWSSSFLQGGGGKASTGGEKGAGEEGEEGGLRGCLTQPWCDGAVILYLYMCVCCFLCVRDVTLWYMW